MAAVADVPEVAVLPAAAANRAADQEAVAQAGSPAVLNLEAAAVVAEVAHLAVGAVENPGAVARNGGQ